MTGLNIRLRGKPGRVAGSDLKVEVAGRIRYPDAFVFCLNPVLTASVVSEPVVIFEVLSDSTQKIDRLVKFKEYTGTDSVRRYVMVEQDRIAAMMFERRDGDWEGHMLYDGATIAMPEIGIDLPLAECYADIVFPPDGEAHQSA